MADDLELEADDFKALPLSVMNSAIVPVVVHGTSYFEYIGTAFNIAPDGVFVTARHVAEDALEKQELHDGSTISLIWLAPDSGRHHGDIAGGPIRLAQITKYEHPESDLAILRAGMVNTETGEPLIMPTIRLSTRLPQVGEKVSAFGYPHSTFTTDSDTPEALSITLEHQLHGTTGEIIDVFEKGRDTVMLPAAGFQTEFVFEGGMSGGPVLNQDGYACGILSFSLRPNEDYPKYSSYAALALSLYPLYVSDGTNTMTVFEMAEAGIVATDEHFDKLAYVNEDGRVGVRIIK